MLRAAARPAASPTARPATADDVKAYKERHGADRGFRGEPEDDGAVRLRVPDDGDDGRPRRRSAATRVRARPPGRPRDRPRRRLASLYNFAVAIDDLDAGITHVVRGEDHLSNTPKQLLVMEALGRPSRRCYAHLPLLHGPDGKKLSKRHGAASVQELRDAGYLPEAVRNYLALLGWGAADDETVLATERARRALRHRRGSRTTPRASTRRSCAG